MAETSTDGTNDTSFRGVSIHEDTLSSILNDIVKNEPKEVSYPVFSRFGDISIVDGNSNPR